MVGSLLNVRAVSVQSSLKSITIQHGGNESAGGMAALPLQDQ